MTRRAAIFVVGLVAAALVGVALLAIPGIAAHKRPTLGLDLQGGLEVTLQAVPPKDRKLTKEDLDRSVAIMRNRVDKLGVSEPEIRTQGQRPDRRSSSPGVKDPAAAAADHRQDRAARALRPRGDLVAAVDRRAHGQPDRDAEALRPARRPAGARGKGDAGHVLRLRPRARSSSRGPRRRRGRRRSPKWARQAADRPQALRACRRARSSSLRRRREPSSARRRAGEPDAELTATSSGTTPPERPAR